MSTFREFSNQASALALEVSKHHASAPPILREKIGYPANWVGTPQVTALDRPANKVGTKATPKPSPEGIH